MQQVTHFPLLSVETCGDTGGSQYKVNGVRE